MPILSTILLSIKGEPRKANLQLNDNSNLTAEILQKYFKKKDEPEMAFHYQYDTKVIFIFGYKKGKKGTENKTEFPAPYSDVVLYGDVLVVVSQSNKWDSPVPFTVEQWNTFCNGSEDEEDGDEDEEEEEDVISEAAESVVEEDDFSDNDSKTSTIIEEDEVDEVVVPVKRRRAAAYNKVDTNGLKEEISIQSEPELNTIRMMCLSSFKYLENNFSSDDIRALEKAIYEEAYNKAVKNYVARSWKAPAFVEFYRQIVRSIHSNIHPESPVKNPRLLMRVLEGEFKLSEIPSMTAFEMFPEKWFELKDKLLQREQKILEGNKSRATDQFKCRRCNKRECTYYELQTRSADEPMTCFISCLNCGKEWRQGG
jgi:DNA-directed RNA polymerase subunit M/transcription elongation factor TFIIS